MNAYRKGSDLMPTSIPKSTVSTRRHRQQPCRQLPTEKNNQRMIYKKIMVAITNVLN